MIKKPRWELYKEKVLKFERYWALTKDNELRECAKTRCSHCYFYDKDTTCNQQRFSWLYEEVEIKYELTEEELAVLLTRNHVGVEVYLRDDATIWQLKEHYGFFKGIIDFENVAFEEVLSNYILVDKEISNENTDK